jgi:hypothetical protein
MDEDSKSGTDHTIGGPDTTLTLIPSCDSAKDLDDDDDDDDDLDFLSPRVFPLPSNNPKFTVTKAGKYTTTTTKKKNNTKPPMMGSLANACGVTSKDNDKEAVRLNEKRNDPMWVEDQGKK